MAFDLADWIASATASVKLAPVTNNKAITDTESEITTDVLFKGLNVTPTRIGFYDGSSWTNFFSSDGQFQVYKDETHFIKYDTTNLKVFSPIANLSGDSLCISGAKLTNLSPSPYYNIDIEEDGQVHYYRHNGTSWVEKVTIGKSSISTDYTEISIDTEMKFGIHINKSIPTTLSANGIGLTGVVKEASAYVFYPTGCVGVYGFAYGGASSNRKIGVYGSGQNIGVYCATDDNGASLRMEKRTGSFTTTTPPTWDIFTSDNIGMFNIDTSGKLWMHNGTSWNNIVSNDSSLTQTVKTTKYPINLAKANQFSKAKFHLVLSAADDPTFKLWNASNVQRGSTLSLINAGSTNEVNGFVELEVFDGGILVNCVYSYRKNTTWYHETQNYFIPYTDVTQLSFDIVGSATYTTSSYCKITNN